MSRTPSQNNRPSGIRQSANGKYIYADCTVTGQFVPMPVDYFKKVLERFGNDEARFFKEFVVRAVIKLREEGKTDNEIRAILGTKEPRVVKEPTAPKAEKVVVEKPIKVAKIQRVQDSDTIVSEVIGDRPGTVVKNVTYSWSHDPQNYFKSATRGVINWEEATKSTCFAPSTFLDKQCEGCEYFDRCSWDKKVTVEQREKLASRGKEVPVIRPINLTGKCFDKPETVEVD